MYKFLWCLLLPCSVYGFSIDSMVKYYNKENFIVINGDKKDSREYIYTTISELIPDEGKSVEKDFTSSNVSTWPIIVEPSEVILENGDQVRLKIEKNYTSSDEDRIFGIAFIPDLIGHPDKKNYNIGFGYKVWFIIPGNKPVYGEMSAVRGNTDGAYIIRNRTNKVLEVDVNYCKNNESSKTCRGQLFIRPETDKKIELGVKVKNAEFSFYTDGDRNQPLKRIKI